ncbi:F-box/FBD/LRR-repeat protein At2g04230 isoform X2 [Triticum aestivum]|uniref:F-box/FBD/LRR-repeat protein At2g04230 isoform X2 n=1 Tax=Triticum aestivum TaxID=4565 RepID=UPI001D00D3CD|nr:F-box/FBD/LRR-repeat protein At2g04230-like isoform X2 [Triticum aestivum]
MEDRGGEIPAKRPPKPFDGGEDRLSAVPDELLIDILLKIRDASAAARTSVLSRRWRRVWTLLPELHFLPHDDPHRIRLALTAHEAPALGFLDVAVIDATPESMVAWLQIAARRLSGHLRLINTEENTSLDEAGERGAFELPCFEDAMSISLELGHLGLAVPSSGVFARLTNLFLNRVRLHGPSMLGDAVSWPRCPSLRRLIVHNADGVRNFAIHSDSLLQMDLRNLRSDNALGLGNFTIRSDSLLRMTLTSLHGLEQLTVMASALQFLSEITNHEYLMEDIKKIPNTALMVLEIVASGHSFGASSFHVLSTCRMLLLKLLDVPGHLVAQTGCPSDCVCDQPPNWKTEELTLYCLREVEIQNLRGTEHETALMKRLFRWATVLEKMTVTFHFSVADSKAKEFCQMLRSFCRPEISIKGQRFA